MKEKNYKKGDIYPENREIRQHFFNLGNKGEEYWDKNVGSNENVEIKTQALQNTKQYGNLFVEYAARYAGRRDTVPSGISITECDTWVFQFMDEDGKFYPSSIATNKNYLLERINQGIKEGVVREIQTKNLETGDTNYGYLLSILYFFLPLVKNTHQIPKETFCNPKKEALTHEDRIKRLQELNANKRNK